jgi:hypothetical protein
VIQASSLRSVAWLAVAPFVVTACIGDATGVVRQLYQCATPTVDTSEWQDGSGVTFDYKLPPHFTWVPAAGEWQSGRNWIKIHVLEPGVLPNDPPVTLTRYSECEADISIVQDVFVQLGLTGIDAPWGTGWYSSATFENVPIDSEGREGTVLVESWTEDEVEVENHIAVFFTFSFRPVGN